ncbi:MAG: hypothetical protein ABSC54_05965 [Smithellaceae bacterium]
MILTKCQVLGAAIAGYAFDGFDIMVYALTVPVLFKDWFAQGFNIVQAGAIGTDMLIGISIGGYVWVRWRLGFRNRGHNCGLRRNGETG